MVSAAHFTLANYSSCHHSDPMRKSCVFLTAVQVTLHLKKSDRMVSEGEKMAKYKPFRFMSSAF